MRRKLIITGVVILAAVVWLLIPRESLLLDRATFITSTKAMNGGKRFHEGIGIYWLTDQDILFSRFEGLNGADRIIYRRNVVTGVERKLVGLSRARDANECEIVDDQCVSPDGKWYVCSARWDNCLLAEVNGDRYYIYPSADDGCYRAIHWLPDSLHWLELYGVNRECHALVLHDTDNPKYTKSIPVAGREKLLGAIRAAVSPQEAIAVQEPDQGDGMDGPREYDPTVQHVGTVQRIKLDAPAQVTAQYRVSAPPGSPDFDVKVSPGGDRLAWHVSMRKNDSFRAWLHRFIPFVRAPTLLQTQVWVSSLDGSNMHEIGVVSEPEKSDEDWPPWLEIKWLPGGKRLSIEYKDALYSVSAE